MHPYIQIHKGMIRAVTSCLLIPSFMKSACSSKNENRNVKMNWLLFLQLPLTAVMFVIFCRPVAFGHHLWSVIRVVLGSAALSALPPATSLSLPWGLAASRPHVAPPEKLGSGWLRVACTCFNRKLRSCLSLTFTPTSISEVVKIALKGERQMEESIQQW